MNTIGFIGVGELALYTIKGLRRGGYAGPILLSPRNHEKAAYLQQNFDCEIAADNQALITSSDIVVIATRPAYCLDCLAELEFKSGQLLISVVAGIEIEQLRTVLPAELEIVRAMPVSSAGASASPTLIYPDHDFVRQLFDYCGNAIAVDNEAFFTQGSILACVYSWFFALYQEVIEATEGPSLPADLSAQLVMGMAKGAAELALANRQQSPGEIAEAIATEGTFSKLGLDLLKDQQAFEPWRAACKLLEQRLAESD
ncbi:MAG: NAD(P)-binding domain-containing protein [Gammaproteobacteria bacterium]|nr:NAD(P)-binding domain-containing protein [Gammaproteobacteria bacterium]